MTNSLDTENEQTPLLDGASASAGIVPARKRASLERRLRAMLEADLASSDGIVISRAGKIIRRHYAGRLGITPGYAGMLLRNVFEEYEARLAAIGTAVSPLEERLRAALEQDRLSADGIRTSREGKISRTYYAARVGVGPHMVGQCRRVLENYEAGSTFDFKSERSIMNMRAWLTERFETGELGIRDGKIERIALNKAFGFSGGSVLTRYPQIRALFEEFDARVAAEGYLPKEVTTQIDRLKQTLTTNCLLNNDGLTVNRSAVAAAYASVKERGYFWF